MVISHSIKGFVKGVYWNTLLTIPFFVVVNSLMAQHTFCETSVMAVQQAPDIVSFRQRLFQARVAIGSYSNLISYVPIRPHILRRSDGSGGFSLSDLNQALALTNSRFLHSNAGIQFYFAGNSPDYIDNTKLYENFNESAVADNRDVSNALNQYYVNTFTNVNGIMASYAYYPYNDIRSTRSVLIVGSGQSIDYLGNNTFPHELGHNFGLIHTHGDNNIKELVTRGTGSNCSYAGDYICDTPADPYGQSGVNIIYQDGCAIYSPTSTVRDMNGQLYSPMTNNIMSYYYDNSTKCPRKFTSGQYDVMQANLELRKTHTAYSLDFPPAIVLPVSSLQAVYNNGLVKLTWLDNAANETGYFIERSSKANSDFIPIGGVGPNVTTFIDQNIIPNSIYYYRVRPSNTTTGSLSGTITVNATSCSMMYTLRDGYWNDANIWSCGRLPTSVDKLYIGHSVTIPKSYQARALSIIYVNKKSITLLTDSHLILGK